MPVLRISRSGIAGRLPSTKNGICDFYDATVSSPRLQIAAGAGVQRALRTASPVISGPMYFFTISAEASGLIGACG